MQLLYVHTKYHETQRKLALRPVGNGLRWGGVSRGSGIARCSLKVVNHILRSCKTDSGISDDGIFNESQGFVGAQLEVI